MQPTHLSLVPANILVTLATAGFYKIIIILLIKIKSIIRNLYYAEAKIVIKETLLHYQEVVLVLQF